MIDVKIEASTMTLDASVLEQAVFDNIAVQEINQTAAIGSSKWRQGIGPDGSAIGDGYSNMTKVLRAEAGRQIAFVDLIMTGTLFNQVLPFPSEGGGAQISVTSQPHPSGKSASGLYEELRSRGFNMPLSDFSREDAARIDKRFEDEIQKAVDAAITVKTP